MRVWLIHENPGADSALEEVLRKAREHPLIELDLLGASAVQPGLADSLRKLLPDGLDAIILHEPACPELAVVQDVLGLEVAALVVVAPERAERFSAVCALRPLAFVPPCASVETFWLALVGAVAAQKRESSLRKELAQFQQRLADRILIERAKGILIRRLQISEEEAYKRLRVLSRRQRRQMRDIAQSLLDTEFLFSADANGAAAKETEKEFRRE